jgi:hypothetical protein
LNKNADGGHSGLCLACTRRSALQLRITKLRQGSNFPLFLNPRKTSESSCRGNPEAWIGGVSTRRVEDLVQTMGLDRISKSTVSKLCQDIDKRVNAFLGRPPEGEWPYLWLDATYREQREGGRIVSVAAGMARGCIVEVGRELIEAKALCAHGQWLPWLLVEFGWSEDTAHRYMQVAKAFQIPHAAEFSVLTIDATALYTLAAPDVPQSARNEAVERAQAGEHISKAEARVAEAQVRRQR